MEPTSWSLPAAFEVIAAAAPERDMLVWKQTRRTYAEVERRTRGLAAFLRRHGIGLRRERHELERWECGQATVALLLYNCPEYIETMLGCFRARAVPVQRQPPLPARGGRGACSTWSAPRPSSTTARSRRSSREAIARTTAAARRRRRRLGRDAARGQHELRGRRRQPRRRGGSAGAVARRPLPRLHGRHDRHRPRACSGARRHLRRRHGRQRGATPEIAGGARGSRRRRSGSPRRRSCTPPRSGRRSRASTTAATVVLHDDAAAVRRAHDPRDGRARAGHPHVDRRRRLSPGRSSRSCGGRRTTSSSLADRDRRSDHERGLQAGAPRAPARTSSSSTATARRRPAAWPTARRETAPRRHGVRPGRGRRRALGGPHAASSSPGDDEIGWTARRGRVPLGYLGDRTKTEETFPIIDGERVAVPGDRARLDAGWHDRAARARLDGREQRRREGLRRGGRGGAAASPGRRRRARGRAAERALRRGGRRRWCSSARVRRSIRVVLREFVARPIARFKAPRAIAFCDAIRRHASGKPDYTWAALRRRRTP